MPPRPTDQRTARPLARPAAVLAAACLALAAGAAGAGPAGAAGAQSSVVSAVPSAATPQVLDGTVLTITKVGTTVLSGGTFSQVASPDGSKTFSRSRLVAFDATTGQVRSGFAPVLDGDVEALLPGPVAGTVLVGGAFKTVNGVPAKSLVLLRLSDGTVDTSFKTPAMDGQVRTLRRVAATGLVYVGGTFRRVGGQLHGGIAALDDRTGAVSPAMTSSVDGHHNWTPDSPTRFPKGAIGVDAIAISPDGRRLVALGNFKTVDGTAHDQIAVFDLSGGSAALADWQTDRYGATCLEGAYDSYVRDVDFSPDGSYFVTVATGGAFGGTLCDAAARWETGATGSALQPTWVDYTGGDTLLSVAVTGEAVYVGGHQRWLNNTGGKDKPAAGAVPRPGLGALDPATGLPLAWNPGRNPRGAGTYDIFVTGNGLYIGSDTPYIGNRQYLRPRLAFFPLAGGAPAASKAVPGLPGTAYLGSVPAGGGSTLAHRSFDGTHAGPKSTAQAQPDLTGVVAAVQIGGALFTAHSDGTLHRRTFSGAGVGPDVVVDPYHDPVWDGVQTGSGNTYDGTPSTFAADLPLVTSLAYDPARSRLLYTLSGKGGLFSRTFSPDSGVTGNTRAVAAGNLPAVDGILLANGQLYYAGANDGVLRRAAFDGTTLSSTRTVVSGPAKDGVDWRARVVFLGPAPS